MRVTIAWMLLVALMPFQIVKSIHYHESIVSSSRSHHNCDGDDFQHSCPICNFTLSPFIHSETPQLTFVAEVLSYVVPSYANGKVFILFHSHGLRAPPFTT